MKCAEQLFSNSSAWDQFVLANSRMHDATNKQNKGEYRDHVPHSHLVLFSLSLVYWWSIIVVFVTVCMPTIVGKLKCAELTQIWTALHDNVFAKA